MRRHVGHGLLTLSAFCLPLATAAFLLPGQETPGGPVERRWTAAAAAEGDDRLRTGPPAPPAREPAPPARTDDLAERLAQTQAAAERARQALAALDAELSDLTTRVDTRERRLTARQPTESALVISLLRLSRNPPETGLLRGDPVAEVVRAGTLIRTLLPTLRAQITQTGTERARLQADRRALAARHLAREAAETALVTLRAELAALSAQRSAVATRPGARPDAALGDGKAEPPIEAGPVPDRGAGAEPAGRPQGSTWQQRQAAGARAAIHALATKPMPQRPSMLPALAAANHDSDSRDADRPAASDAGPGPAAASWLPVAGRIRVAFGDAETAGGTSRGFEIETEPGAVVQTPYAGQIRFAGPFRRYGPLLIVEHRNGYHSLIAGLGRIDTPVGREVTAGEPVGTMGSPPDASPSLYYELWRHGVTVDPRRLDGRR